MAISPLVLFCIHKSLFVNWDFFLSWASDKWSPALQIRTVLLSIQALLSAPNPDDPLANDVAEQWKTNEVKAIETGEENKRRTTRDVLWNEDEL